MLTGLHKTRQGLRATPYPPTQRIKRSSTAPKQNNALLCFMRCYRAFLFNIMETIIKREEITEETYREILDVETHNNHEIIKDDNGTLRWKQNPTVRHYLKNISLNDLCPLLMTLGYGKNSEVYRKLYRDMGYSLSGYWEIFFWEANNEDASEYVPNAL